MAGIVAVREPLVRGKSCVIFKVVLGGARTKGDGTSTGLSILVAMTIGLKLGVNGPLGVGIFLEGVMGGLFEGVTAVVGRLNKKLEGDEVGLVMGGSEGVR